MTGAFSNKTNDTYYLLNDHLGSPQVLVDATGKTKENLSFSAWGERRAVSFDPNGVYTPGLNLLNSYALTQGFTGHEQDDLFGFINMKGRIYDPKLGRFLSADPFVQEPDNTQSYNRYSYVVNNPLSFTDPTGYLFSGIRNFIRNNFEAIRTIVAIASILMPGSGSLLQIMAGAATNSFLLTAIATGSLESGLQAGLMSGLAAGLSAGFASEIGGSAMLETAVFGLGKHIAHGVSQGVVSLLQGGKFRDGFIGGFFGHAAGKLGQGLGFGTVGGIEGRAGRTLVAAMVGGLVSKHTGGKFANGAITAAFTHLFNAEGHPEDEESGKAAIEDFDDVLVSPADFVDVVDGFKIFKIPVGPMPSTRRVGRWMSKTEFKVMNKTGRVVEGAGGRTYVVNPANPTAFTGAGNSSSIYAEFNVPTGVLKPGSKPEWSVIPGPNVTTRLYGPAPAELAPATCLVCVIGNP